MNYRLILSALVVGSVVFSGCSSTASPAPAATATVAAVGAATTPAAGATPAPKPADASIKITSPKAGDSLNAGDVKVTIDYTGPALIAAAQGKKLDDYHVHYLLDEDATPYLGTTTAIPTGNPKIIHSAAKEVTFSNVTAGSHTVTVIMGGLNHISVTPPVSDKVTFTVK